MLYCNRLWMKCIKVKKQLSKAKGSEIHIQRTYQNSNTNQRKYNASFELNRRKKKLSKNQ